ncbi:MAG: efflux RND transporter periplasmic adaptor subunit [Prosthecobacter sp.]|uniref:efflux RND transporter periplasmic adaptor subunit n=1 Tax=Prosthecobacter sp. TaxID=1965333 RepID=UPI003BB0B442
MRALQMGACLMAAFTLGACHSKKGGHAAVMVLTHPLQQDTTISREYACQINSCKNIKVLATGRGYLELGKLKEGQHVNAGDVMFKIVPGSKRTALNRAEAVAEVAKGVFENTERRLKNQQATDQELSEAKAQWDEKLELVKAAQNDADVNTIKAPFSGLMSRLLLAEGSLVDQGAVLTTLSDNSEMQVIFNVSEAESREYAAQAQSGENKQVTLVLANGKIFEQPGRLNVAEAKADEQSGMTPLHADFANPTGLLRNGESGIVRVWKMIKQAVLVPQKATFEKRGHHYVFVVGKDQVMQQREIQISAELEDLFMVSEGVGADDMIVFAGMGLAKDGAKAEGAEFEAPEKAFAHLKIKGE